MSDAAHPSAIQLLRRHHTATLTFGDRRASVRFIVEPSTGRLVLPIEPAASRHAEVLLCMPDEPACELQAPATISPIDRPEASASCDRWAAYHGHPAPSGSVWVIARIDGAKSSFAVFGAEEFENPTVLPREGSLLRLINADRVRLASICRRVAGVPVADPLCVGIDPGGMDIRARFGIIRVEFAPVAGPSVPAVSESSFGDLLNALAADTSPPPPSPAQA